MSHGTEEWCKIWRKTNFPFKNDKNLVNFDLSTKNSKKFALWLVSFIQSIAFDLKKYRVIYHDTRVWCKIWFCKFSPKHTKVSKLGLLLGPFMQSRKYMSLELTGELSIMTMENDAKLENELTCQLTIKIRNLTNFDPSTQKSQKLVL